MEGVVFGIVRVRVLLVLVLFEVCYARHFVEDYVELDVKGSLSRAQGELSARVSEEDFGDGSAFALPLLHRSFVKGSSNLAYGERFHARLKRDFARVSSINERIKLAVSGVSSSNLDSRGKGGVVSATGDFESPVVSGMEEGSGEYFSQIGVGVPPRMQLMVLDTGSDVNWIQCKPCSDCYQQRNPIFDPSLSSSYASVSCGDSLCQRLDVSGCSMNGSCMYQVSYGDGSYTVGSLATETVTLGNKAVPNVALGCGHDNEGLFNASAGILGLGGGSLSLPSQLPHKQNKIFSYCLVARDSGKTSTLQFGPASIPRNSVFTPMPHNPRLDTFYYAEIAGISVARRMLNISASVFRIDESGNGGTIIDSGTAVTRLQTEAYNAFRDAFLERTQNLPKANGVSLFDTCYNLSGVNSVAIPAVALHFPGVGSLKLPPENCLVPLDTDGIFCFAFAPTSSSLSIIGNIQQQGIRVSFDRVRNRFGFAPKSC